MRLLSTLAVLACTNAFAADAKYALTGDNTKIEWTGTKPGGKHDGGFKTVSGFAKVDSKGVSFEVEIDTDSLYSDNDGLTKHLKSPDFFDVKTHAKAKFVSKEVKKGDKGYTVKGDLTILGKTKEISFPAEISLDNGMTVKAEFKINKNDYGMTYGKGKMDDDVTVKVKVEAK